MSKNGQISRKFPKFFSFDYIFELNLQQNRIEKFRICLENYLFLAKINWTNEIQNGLFGLIHVYSDNLKRWFQKLLIVLRISCRNSFEQTAFFAFRFQEMG